MNGSRQFRTELSIVIVNWKSRDFLRRCLATIYKSTNGLPFEVVVVDNASDDKCGEMLQSEFPLVNFFQSQENLGFARANNLGAQRSSGKYLLFLNPDTEVLDGAVERLMRCLDETPQCAIGGPKLLNSDGTVQTTCVRAFPTLLGELLECDFLRKRFPRAPWWGTAVLFEEREQPVSVDAVSGASLMIRRDVFTAVGGFTTSYFMYAEDVDLCFKVSKAGWICQFVPRAIVVHHGARSSQARPEDFFADVVLRESRLVFFRQRRGSAYARLYKTAMAALALTRVLLLVPIAGRSLKKWAHILRWALGTEEWVRRLPESHRDA